MHGRLIILHLLICLFYPLYFNIKSLISPKITLALSLLLAFCKKWNFAFTLRKNWCGQNRSSWTDSTGPEFARIYKDFCALYCTKVASNVGSHICNLKSIAESVFQISNIYAVIINNHLFY